VTGVAFHNSDGSFGLTRNHKKMLFEIKALEKVHRLAQDLMV
jgi:hypothetical protein